MHTIYVKLGSINGDPACELMCTAVLLHLDFWPRFYCLLVIYQDDGTDRVFVVGARGATGLVLTVGSEVFEESGRSLVRGTLDYLQGLKVCLFIQCVHFTRSTRRHTVRP